MKYAYTLLFALCLFPMFSFQRIPTVQIPNLHINQNRIHSKTTPFWGGRCVLPPIVLRSKPSKKRKFSKADPLEAGETLPVEETSLLLGFVW